MARRIPTTPDDSLTDKQLVHLWRRFGRAVVDPRLTWRGEEEAYQRELRDPRFKARHATDIARFNESVKVRTSLERLPIRRRITAYAEWLQALASTPAINQILAAVDEAGLRAGSQRG